MFFMPETPAWLLGKNREEEARKSLQFFRGRYLIVELISYLNFMAMVHLIR
jgi:Sugar (and other) transporter